MNDDRGPARPAPDDGGLPANAREDSAIFCDVCGMPMHEVHCKVACPNCGYLRDCSDP